MQWMVVLAGVDQLQTVATALLQRRRSHLGIRLSVDRPGLHRTVSTEPGFKHERYGGSRRGFGRVTSAQGALELLIAPKQFRGLLPAWRTGLVSILDDNPHAGCLHMFAHLAENPDTGVVHLDDRTNP